MPLQRKKGTSNPFAFKAKSAGKKKSTGKPGQTHQNYSDKNCNISNCNALIINALDLLMLDKFRIFIV